MKNKILVLLISFCFCAICTQKALSQVIADVSAITPVFKNDIESEDWLNYPNKPAFIPNSSYTFILKKGHISIKSTTTNEILFDQNVIDMIDDKNLSSKNVIVKDGVTADRTQKISFYMDMREKNIFGILKITPNNEEAVYGITIHLKNFKFLSE